MNITTTELEKQVFNALIDICMEECESDMQDLIETTGLEMNTIKGVVGSLVRKELVTTEEEKRNFKTFLCIRPIIHGDALSFGCDEYTEEDAEIFKLM